MTSKFLNVGKIFKFVLTVAFIWFVYTQIDLQSLLATLKKTHLHWLFLALFIYVLNRFLISLRWKVILTAYGFPITFLKVAKIIFVSMPAGFITPGGAGADLARGYQLSKQHGGTADVAGSIVIDRLIGLYSMFFVAIAAAFISPPLRYLEETKIVLSLCVLALVFGGLVGVWILKKFGHRINLSFSPKLDSLVKKLVNALVGNNVLQKTFIPITLISLVIQLGRCVLFYVIFLSLGVQLDFVYFLVLIPLVYIFLFLPISLGGFGMREASLLVLFAQLGVREEISVSAGLIGYSLEMIMLLCGIFIFLFDKQEKQSEN